MTVPKASIATSPDDQRLAVSSVSWRRPTRTLGDETNYWRNACLERGVWSHLRSIGQFCRTGSPSGSFFASHIVCYGPVRKNCKRSKCKWLYVSFSSGNDLAFFDQFHTSFAQDLEYTGRCPATPTGGSGGAVRRNLAEKVQPDFLSRNAHRFLIADSLQRPPA